MREIIYESTKVKVYKAGDTYELFSVSARNYDGIYDVSLNLQGTYTDVYHRDNLGRTYTYPRYNRNNETGYGYKAVMSDVKLYER